MAKVQTNSNNKVYTINGKILLAPESSESGNTEAITALTQSSGSISLSTNTLYSGSFSGDVTFVLPIPEDTSVFNQIKVMCVVSNSSLINFGTTYFFNKQEPAITDGNYDIYFDYDNNIEDWVCGVISKGNAS